MVNKLSGRRGNGRQNPLAHCPGQAHSLRHKPMAGALEMASARTGLAQSAPPSVAAHRLLLCEQPCRHDQQSASRWQLPRASSLESDLRHMTRPEKIPAHRPGPGSAAIAARAGGNSGREGHSGRARGGLVLGLRCRPCESDTGALFKLHMIQDIAEPNAERTHKPFFFSYIR